MYSELIIRPKALQDKIMYPDTARSLVALALDGTVFNPLLLNRDSHGKTIQDKYWHEEKTNIEAALPHPPVASFDGGKGFIRIFMLGETGRDLMAETAPIVAAKLAQHLDSAYAFSINEGKCTIEERNTPVLYSIRRMVMTKNPKKGQRYFKIPPQEVSDDIRRTIMRGLLSQARWLDENTSGRYKLHNRIPDEETLGFSIFDGEPCPVLIKDNNFAYGYSNLTFSMNLDLMGPWLAGHLRSRGYGQIRKLVLKGKSHD